MGKYSSESDTSDTALKIRGKHRSSSNDSSSTRSRVTKKCKKSKHKSSKSKDRYSRSSRRSRSDSYSPRSRTRRSNSKEKSKYRHRRSKSKERYRSRRSRSKSYIREFSSKSNRRRSSSSSSSSSSRYSDDNKRKITKEFKRKDKGISSKTRTKAGSSKTNDNKYDNLIIDSQTIEEINEDRFESTPFTSSKSQNVPDTIVIDLKKQTIKVPEVEQTEPDSIFHHNLFLSEEARIEKWTKELFSYRQKALQRSIRN